MTKTLDDLYDRLRQKSKAFKSVFSTPDGKKVLQTLSEEFDHIDLMDDISERTAYNLGRRDVVKYIEQVIKYSEKQDD